MAAAYPTAPTWLRLTLLHPPGAYPTASTCGLPYCTHLAAANPTASTWGLPYCTHLAAAYPTALCHACGSCGLPLHVTQVTAMAHSVHIMQALAVAALEPATPAVAVAHPTHATSAQWPAPQLRGQECNCLAPPRLHFFTSAPSPLAIIRGLFAPPRTQQCCKNGIGVPPLSAAPVGAPLVFPGSPSASSAQQLNCPDQPARQGSSRSVSAGSARLNSTQGSS